jgi:hypothetical protein
MIGGVDCQNSCSYLFKRVNVKEELKNHLPVFDQHHQFMLSAKISVKNRNFGREFSKQLTFNSVRCAELFLMKDGEAVKTDAPIGDGTRLAAYLGIATPDKKAAAIKKQSVRLCKAGELCTGAVKKGKKTIPALAASQKQYCSKFCRECYPVRSAKRQNPTPQQAVGPEMAVLAV